MLLGQVTAAIRGKHDLTSNQMCGHKYRQMSDAMQSDACASYGNIQDAGCIGMDAILMSEACMTTLAGPLGLESADVTAAATAWTAVHQACIAITDAVRAWL